MKQTSSFIIYAFSTIPKLNYLSDTVPTTATCVIFTFGIKNALRNHVFRLSHQLKRTESRNSSRKQKLKSSL